MRRTVALLCGSIAFAFALAGEGATADHPVKLIVPWAAGGESDSIFRPFASLLQKSLASVVAVENIAGAAGTVGALEARSAAPDGQTLFAVNDAIHLSYYTGVADVRYSDFEPVCMVASTPSILAASPKTRWKSLQELISDARSNPGQISVAATLGSTSHIFPALLEKTAGLKFSYTSYEGFVQRMHALLGGHAQLSDTNLTQKPRADAGQLKFLAIGTEKRSPYVPNLATFRESGLDIVYAISRGVMAPKGIPSDVLARLASACASAARDVAFADAMKQQGTEVRYMDRAGFAAFLKRNDDLNRELTQSLGLLKR